MARGACRLLGLRDVPLPDPRALRDPSVGRVDQPLQVTVAQNPVWGVGTRAEDPDLGGSVAASHYKEGDPEKEIIRLGEELDAGLIVMGGRRRPWFKRIFGAGFSENVFRRAKRPVLIVGGHELRGSTIPR